MERKGPKIWAMVVDTSEPPIFTQTRPEVWACAGNAYKCVPSSLPTCPSGNVNDSIIRKQTAPISSYRECQELNRSLFVLRRKTSIAPRLIKSVPSCLIPGDPALVLRGVRIHIPRLHQRRVSENSHMHAKDKVWFHLHRPMRFHSEV